MLMIGKAVQEQHNIIANNIIGEIRHLTGKGDMASIDESKDLEKIILKVNEQGGLCHLFEKLLDICEAFAFLINHQYPMDYSARKAGLDWKKIIDENIKACKKYAPKVIDDMRQASPLRFTELKILYGELPL